MRLRNILDAVIEGVALSVWLGWLITLPVILIFLRPDKPNAQDDIADHFHFEQEQQQAQQQHNHTSDEYGKCVTYCGWCGQYMYTTAVDGWEAGRVETRASLFPCADCKKVWRERTDVVKL